MRHGHSHIHFDRWHARLAFRELQGSSHDLLLRHRQEAPLAHAKTVRDVVLLAEHRQVHQCERWLQCLFHALSKINRPLMAALELSLRLCLG